MNKARNSNDRRGKSTSATEPLELRWWSISKTIAWIALRDMRRVAPIISASTSRSFLFDAIAEFDVSGAKAEEELFQQLLNGELKAWGNVKAGDMLSVIPRKLCASLRDYYVYWDAEPPPTLAPIPAHRIDPRATNANTHTYSGPLYLPSPTTKYRKVRFEKENILKIWPAADALHMKSPSKGGRKQVWDWNAARQYAYDLLDQKGDFDDPKQKTDWDCQARLESAISDHLGEQRSIKLDRKVEGPSASRTRLHAADYVRQWRQRNRRDS